MVSAGRSKSVVTTALLTQLDQRLRVRLLTYLSSMRGCVECGGDLPPGAGPRQRYCQSCKHERVRQYEIARARRRRGDIPLTVPCMRCGTDVERADRGTSRRYCAPCREIASLERRQREAAKRIPRVPPIVSCEDCGVDVVRTSNGVPKRCVACQTEARARQAQAYYERNRERIRVAKRDYMRKRHESKPDLNRLQKLRAKYGLTPEEFDRLVESTGPDCPLCGEEFRGRGPHKRCVDHDHGSGRVRGLICSACNTALGYFEDDPHRIESAIRYLQRHL